MIRLDPEKLVEKGAIDFGNSDFRLIKTTCCKQYFIYEAEVGHIYYNPENFKEVCLEFSIEKCPSCHNKKWDFIEIDDCDIPSNWSWAFQKTKE